MIIVFPINYLLLLLLLNELCVFIGVGLHFARGRLLYDGVNLEVHLNES